MTRVEVFDLLGRRVRTLDRGPRAAGAQRVAWDGRDAAGAPVTPGLYHVRVDAGERAWSGAMVRVR
jgi:flagellar hook assembly protein FlgD